MKTYQRFACLGLALVCLHAPPSAHAGLRIGGGELNAQATAEVAWTDRVRPQAGSRSDTVYRLVPALSFTRETPLLNLNAGLSTPITRYDRLGALDSTDFSAYLNGTVPYASGPRFSGNWGISYFEGVQDSFLTNRTLESENFNANLTGLYRVGNRLNLRGRVGYSDRSSSDVFSDFTNSNKSTLGAVGLYAHQLIRGRVGTYVEYRRQNRKTTRGALSDGINLSDGGLNFGLTGQLLPERLFPNLEADLSFGFASTSRLREGGGRSNRLTLNGSLAYPATPTTKVSLNATRNLSLTDDDRTVEVTNLILGVNYNPRNRWSGNASIGTRRNDFIGTATSRKDDVFTAQVGVGYMVAQFWRVNAFYNLRNSSSNSAINDFSSSRFGLSTTLLY